MVEKQLRSYYYEYGIAEFTGVRDRVYYLLTLASDRKDGNAFVADYDLPSEFLFFALMNFCQPQDPVQFARHLQEVLRPRVDAIASMIIDSSVLQAC